MRRALSGLVALAFALLAVVVHHTTPSEEELTGPFVETVSPGTWGEGRDFAVRQESVGLAGEASDDDWTGPTAGVWVTVGLSAEAALDPGSVTGSLWLGEDRYDASTRSDATLNAATLAPGLPVTGFLLFEVPTSAVEAHGADARLWLGRVTAPRLDSVVEVPIALDGLELTPTFGVPPVERTTR